MLRVALTIVYFVLTIIGACLAGAGAALYVGLFLGALLWLFGSLHASWPSVLGIAGVGICSILAACAVGWVTHRIDGWLIAIDARNLAALRRSGRVN